MKNTRLPKPILNKILSILSAITLLALIFLNTDPEQVPLVLLLLPFLLIGYVVYSIADLALRLNQRLQSKNAVKKLIALSLAFGVVALLLLASLGQLTVRDGLLVIGFTALFLFYIMRADFLENKDRS